MRKGALVGCKVTLRKRNLSEFLDNFALAFPRMENFKGVSYAKSLKPTVRKKGREYKSFALTELVMFYPIELGLGINTEVRKGDLQFAFNTYDPQEQIFLLTSSKIFVNK